MAKENTEYLNKVEDNAFGNDEGSDMKAVRDGSKSVGHPESGKFEQKGDHPEPERYRLAEPKAAHRLLRRQVPAAEEQRGPRNRPQKLPK